MRPLVLLGGGGRASDVLAVIEALAADGSGPFEVQIADDHWARPERFDNRSVAVQLVDSLAAGATLAPFLVAVGFPVGRRRLHDLATGLGGVAAEAVVHPQASVGCDARLSPGVVVMGQTWISPGTELGLHTHVCYGASIGHDTRLGRFCSVMPGARIGGEVEIGDGVLIEAGAIVLRGHTIGAGATIGAGVVVGSDVEPGEAVAQRADTRSTGHAG